MEITRLRLADLKPYANNVKLHPKEQIEQIKQSIMEFGNNDPIAVDENHVIIEGHGRYQALAEMGEEYAECIVLEGMTEDQKNAYRLVHNKLTMNSGFDMEALEEELDKIEEIDMEQFDFELPELDDKAFEINEDDVPEVDEEHEPTTKMGDLWKLGNHYLLCGDSTKKEDVDKLMSGGSNNLVKADMVFTDPPYGYNYQSNMRTKSEKFDVLENDEKILDFFPNLLGRVNGFVMICTTWKVLDKWLPLFKQYFDLSNMIIWDKGGGYIGDLKHTFGTDYEIILCSNNNAEIKGKRIGSVWSIGKDKESDYEHPTQKPVELSATAISSTTEHGNIVLDCFGGSGSTLIACEQLNRKCYTMELDPKYCDVIIKRWEQMTGMTAELVASVPDGE